MPQDKRFDTCPDMTGGWSSKWAYRKQQTGVEDVIPMWVADMDFDTAPPIKEAVLRRAQHGVYGYTQVDRQYLNAFVNWVDTRCRWRIRPQWISQTPGVICAIHTAVRAFSEPGDGVLFQPPVYHPFYRVMERTGRRAVENPLVDLGGSYGLDLEHFEQVIQKERPKLFLLCNPHNPVGKVFTRQELLQMGEICRRHGVLVVSDEIHSDLTLPGVQHIPFGSISEADAANCIVCTAPSKTFNLAGLQLSNIIIPSSGIRARYQQAFDEAGIPQRPNLFALSAAAAAYESGGEWLDDARDYLLENRNYAAGYLEEHLPQLRPYRAEGTYFLWLDCRMLGLSPQELESFFLKEAKTWFNQGYTFGKQGAGFVRINLACPRSLLSQALQQIKHAISQLDL